MEYCSVSVWDLRSSCAGSRLRGLWKLILARRRVTRFISLRKSILLWILFRESPRQSSFLLNQDIFLKNQTQRAVMTVIHRHNYKLLSQLSITFRGGDDAQAALLISLLMSQPVKEREKKKKDSLWAASPTAGAPAHCVLRHTDGGTSWQSRLIQEAVDALGYCCSAGVFTLQSWDDCFSTLTDDS